MAKTAHTAHTSLQIHPGWSGVCLQEPLMSNNILPCTWVWHFQAFFVNYSENRSGQLPKEPWAYAGGGEDSSGQTVWNRGGAREEMGWLRLVPPRLVEQQLTLENTTADRVLLLRSWGLWIHSPNLNAKPRVTYWCHLCVLFPSFPLLVHVPTPRSHANSWAVLCS